MNHIIKVVISSLFFVSFSVNAQDNKLDNVVENNLSNLEVINKNINNKNDGLSSIDILNLYQQKVKTIELNDSIKAKIFMKIKESQPELKLNRNQFFVIADRNPKNQVATLAFWNNENKTVEVSNYTKISTGSVRKGHFYTPLGWFENLPEHKSYRAEGTKNENGIRGYGRKGMRVWDFGWTPSSSGAVKGLNIDIRFQMHATDPDFLEPRLGVPDSKGCVRIHSTLNQFLDNYGIIDSEYEKINSWVLKKDRIKIQDAGTFLLVVDTSEISK